MFLDKGQRVKATSRSGSLLQHCKKIKINKKQSERGPKNCLSVYVSPLTNMESLQLITCLSEASWHLISAKWHLHLPSLKNVGKHSCLRVFTALRMF